LDKFLNIDWSQFHYLLLLKLAHGIKFFKFYNAREYNTKIIFLK
jgi:hypothetical protein